MFGWCPMPMNRPSVSAELSALVLRWRSFTPTTCPTSTPSTSATSMFQRNETLGCAMARSCMIFDARSSSLRCTMVTCDANLVRNSASSMAVSPPPTTITRFPRKKKPSHVAQADTP